MSPVHMWKNWRIGNNLLRVSPVKPQKTPKDSNFNNPVKLDSNRHMQLHSNTAFASIQFALVTFSSWTRQDIRYFGTFYTSFPTWALGGRDVQPVIVFCRISVNYATFADAVLVLIRHVSYQNKPIVCAHAASIVALPFAFSRQPRLRQKAGPRMHKAMKQWEQRAAFVFLMRSRPKHIHRTWGASWDQTLGTVMHMIRLLGNCRITAGFRVTGLIGFILTCAAWHLKNWLSTPCVAFECCARCAWYHLECRHIPSWERNLCIWHIWLWDRDVRDVRHIFKKCTCGRYGTQCECIVCRTAEVSI